MLAVRDTSRVPLRWLFVCLAGGIGVASHAQSVTVYGIVDAAVRRTTHEQTVGQSIGQSIGQSSGSLNQMVGGGLSQSRLGITLSEDMGGGLKAVGNLEHRFNLDTGAIGAPTFWQQSWIGLLSDSAGRISLGRQYNVLFDLYTSTFPSFRYSPYIEIFKPELGFALGARNDNMVKYVAVVGDFTGELQASAGEGATTAGSTPVPGLGAVPFTFSQVNKSVGGMLRYSRGAFAVGAGHLQVIDNGRQRARATTVGASYAAGPVFLNASWAYNAFDAGFGGAQVNTPSAAANAAVTTAVNTAVLNQILASSTTGDVTARGGISHRNGYAFGATWLLTPEFNIGGHFWDMRQAGRTSFGDGRAKFLAVVADYALSRRTDLYVEADDTRFSGGLAFTNGATRRAGYMAGVRHRF